MRASEPSVESVGLSGVAIVVATALSVVVVVRTREVLLSSGELELELLSSGSSTGGLLLSFLDTLG